MPWCAARPCRAAATDGLFANSVPNCLARPCRGSCLPCGWLWWQWLWPVVRALVTSGDTKVTVCLFYGIVPNVIVYIYIYLLHFGTTIPTVFPPVPGCHHVSALAILPLPVVASAVARRQAACRLLVHTVCQAGMKAGAGGCRATRLTAAAVARIGFRVPRPGWVSARAAAPRRPVPYGRSMGAVRPSRMALAALRFGPCRGAWLAWLSPGWCFFRLEKGNFCFLHNFPPPLFASCRLYVLSLQ